MMLATYKLAPALIATSLLAACAAPRMPTASTPAAEQTKAITASADALSIPLYQPRDNLLTAGQPAASDWAPLAAQGIKTVINLRPEGEMQGRDEAAEVRAAGMRYIEIPVANADAVNADNARKLHEALGAAYQDGPVLLHCASANRAGGLLALALAMVTEHGMTLEDALDVGRKAGMKSTEDAVRKAVEAR
ncbi:MAG: sulfur transferase domain-containing protein [Pseudomonadota bacterium]|nr:sulfur transferase domain-containing protein [Pseudomonadota bacterium]